MSQRRARRQRLPVEPVRLEVTSLSHEGRGIGYLNGKVVFIDGALPGEIVMASYVRKRSQFDELRVIEVEQPSTQRVTPVCEYADRCGGCSLQHLDAAAQLDFKQATLLEHLQKTTGLAPDSLTLLPQLKGDTMHYRRKARLAVRMVMKKGGALVGFREKYSTFITAMDDCKVLVDDVARLLVPLRELISGLLANQDIPQIEVAVGEQQLDGQPKNRVALVFRHLKSLAEEDQQALRDFAATQELDLYLQPAGLDSVHKLYPSEGVERLQYFLPEFDLALNFHPTDFTQVNAEINRRIVSQAIQLLEISSDDCVLDLFCGLGNFTLALARRCRRVVGVEGSHEMVLRGEENAALNDITNVSFEVANLCDSLTNRDWFKLPFTKVLLDPPRSGAIEIVQQITELRASKIVYVSCNPATLARDAAHLLANGYRLKSAGVMDMFPHTAHVESMAIFELSN
ncbi:MAG: 23S rRNA (uracil(1939)-C(5))-methyltransferase RlmD [Proteobacteria bacterium]|nr:23S rRNA (uracil(1939)-C(5))-methyltransferase RlmD [Pseudomonadota bacterium]